MNQQTILESIALAATAYESVPPRPMLGEQTFYSAPNGVQFFVRQQGPHLSITFRGSNSPLDWAHNLAFARMEVATFCDHSGIKVHRGFLAAYMSEHVRGILHGLAREAQVIRVTGHSYGAALATLCALDLRLAFPEIDVEAVLFGAPRVGNKAFMRCYNSHVIRTVRVECGNDVVTKVPLVIMGFRHVGSRFHVGARRFPLAVSTEDHYPQRYYQGLINRLLP